MSYKSRDGKTHQSTILIAENGLPIDAIATISGSYVFLEGSSSLSYTSGSSTVVLPAGNDLTPVTTAKARYTGKYILLTDDGTLYYIDRSSIDVANRTFTISLSDKSQITPASIDTSAGWKVAEADIVNRIATTSAAKIDNIEFRDMQFQMELDGDPVTILDAAGNEINPATQEKQDEQTTELQSINTELDTQTLELQQSNTELSQANTNLNNIDLELEAVNLELDTQTSRLNQINTDLNTQADETQSILNSSRDEQSNSFLVRPSEDLIDSFGRTRTIQPLVMFEAAMTYNKRPQLFQEKFVGTASSTHLTDESLVRLDVGTAAGDRAVRQTRRYFRYQSGRTHYKTYVGILGPSKANVVSRLGGFDDTDGFYFEQNGAGLKIVRRDSTSGTVVNEEVARADWNVDRLDGTGPSGITLNPEALTIYGDKYNWHGGGPTTLGIYLNGRFNPCHTFQTGNTQRQPITSLPNLPIRYELVNTGTSASASSMYQGASSVIIEGGNETDQSISFSSNLGITPRSVGDTASVPLISIQPKLTFEGKMNKSLVIPLEFQVQSGTTLLLQVIFDGDIAGGTWVDVSADSATQVNRGGTSVTNGRVIDSRYLSGSSGSASDGLQSSVSEDLFLTLDIDGAAPESITIAARTLTGTASVLASVNWRELY